MNSAGESRANAAIVGVLFIIGTATGIAAAVLSKPLLDAPDYLSAIATHEGAMPSAALLNLLMGIACTGIGLGLYPIMRRYSIGLAIGVVGFRVIEGVVEILGGLSLIALQTLSREFVRAGAPDVAFFQTIGAVVKAASAWLNNGAVLICWCIGAFMYYGLFYRYRLVPRWISVWGLIGITLTTISAVLLMAGLIPGFGTVQLIFNLPIAPQEMIFAAWLIAKGVNLAAAPSRPGQLASGELLGAA